MAAGVERLEQLGHTALAPTVAGHGHGVPKNVTHAESTKPVVDYIIEKKLTDFILVGHGYAGTIISKVAEAVPERIRRLVFWSAFVLCNGETALEMLPSGTEVFAKMAAESVDDTGSLRRLARCLHQRCRARTGPARLCAALARAIWPWVERLDMTKFHSLSIPRSFLVGTEDLTFCSTR